VIADIRKFKADNGLDRLVMVWCGSTEVFMQESAAHQSLAAFEAALEASDPAIPSSMVYAYAALKEGIPYANGAPNLTCDIPAMMELAAQTRSPITGKDLKTGRTLIKTIIAPGLKARLLGVEGWYSTNILGNRDGEVLDDPESFKTKEESKKSGLDYIFQAHLYPDLYKEITTSSASTTTRRAATTRKAGTTSIWWAGSATRCSSRSTSCAATASWRRRSCSTWRCCSTWPSAPGCRASRSGCRSTSRARSTRPGCIRSTTCSSS
jgi:hypothetical protein